MLQEPFRQDRQRGDFFSKDPFDQGPIDQGPFDWGDFEGNPNGPGGKLKRKLCQYFRSGHPLIFAGLLLIFDLLLLALNQLTAAHGVDLPWLLQVDARRLFERWVQSTVIYTVVWAVYTWVHGGSDGRGGSAEVKGRQSIFGRIPGWKTSVLSTTAGLLCFVLGFCSGYVLAVWSVLACAYSLAIYPRYFKEVSFAGKHPQLVSFLNALFGGPTGLVWNAALSRGEKGYDHIAWVFIIALVWFGYVMF